MPGTPEPATTTATPSEEHLVITGKCQDVIDHFRKGDFSRGEALKQVTLLIKGAGSKLSKDEAQRALDSYVDMVLQYSRELRPPSRGRNPSRSGGERERSRGRERHRSRSRSGRRRSDARPSQTRDKSARPSKRRRRHHRAHSSSLSGSETDGSCDTPTKKVRANASNYGWASAAQAVRSSARPDIQKTARLLKEYRLDVAADKADLLDTTIAPEFPDSEWNNLLLGKPVDFDVLLTSNFSSKTDDKHVEQVGDVELSYTSREPARKVTRYGDWVTAFEMFQEATVFAFPHRRSELAVYRTHIIRQFRTNDKIFDARVIDYDRADRKSVSQNRGFLLSDLTEFFPLYVQFISSTGSSTITATVQAASSSGKRLGGGKSKPSNRKTEACIRYNNDACPNLASNCRYQHICSGCNAKGHREPACPGGVKPEA